MMVLKLPGVNKDNSTQIYNVRNSKSDFKKNISLSEKKKSVDNTQTDVFKAKSNDISFKGGGWFPSLSRLFGFQATIPKLKSFTLADIEKVLTPEEADLTKKIFNPMIRSKFRAANNALSSSATMQCGSIYRACKDSAMEEMANARTKMLETEQNISAVLEDASRNISAAKKRLEPIKAKLYEKAQAIIPKNSDATPEKAIEMVDSLFIRPSDLDELGNILQSTIESFNRFTAETKKFDAPDLDIATIVSVFDKTGPLYRAIKDSYSNVLSITGI